ncbi:MAG: P-loop NTPase [Candidatus Woesearchaeota archaeon]
MAKFITIMSGKGGVGKTTTSINLASAMSKKSDVILIDGNLSSPNISIHLGNPFFPITIHDVMQDLHPIQSAIYNHNGLKVIPADTTIDSLKLVNFEKLKEALQDLHLHADYVIIDGSPGIGRESERLLELSDELLIVTNPDHASIMDAKRLAEFAKRKKVTIIGVLVTKYKNRSYKLKLEDIESLLEIGIIGVIKEDKRFEKSISKKIPYIHLYPKRKPVKTYHELASIITGKVL